MPKQFFIKEVLGSGFMVNGTRVPFEPLDGDQGVVVLDDTVAQDKIFIEGLNATIGKYGIAKISEGEYGAKKLAYPYSEEKLQQKLQKDLLQLHQSPADKANPLARNEGVAAGSITSQITAKPNVAQLAAEMTAPVPLQDGLAEAFKPATGRPRGRPPKVASVS